MSPGLLPLIHIVGGDEMLLLIRSPLGCCAGNPCESPTALVLGWLSCAGLLLLEQSK